MKTPSWRSRTPASRSRAGRVFFRLNGANTNPAMQKLKREFAPSSRPIPTPSRSTGALRADAGALPEARRARARSGVEASDWRYHKDFVRAGAKLAAADKEKLKAMNAELATLGAASSRTC